MFDFYIYYIVLYFEQMWSRFDYMVFILYNKYELKLPLALLYWYNLHSLVYLKKLL